MCAIERRAVGADRAAAAGPNAEAARAMADHREVIDAIAFKYRTGTPWMDLPERFGSWKGAHNRLRMWAIDGTWEKVFTALLAQADAEGELEWVIAVDSTIVRAHQHAAEARKKGPRPASPTTVPSDGPAAD
jgi:transposase